MATPDFTIGVEEEYQIIDAATGALKPQASGLLSHVRQDTGGSIQSELKQSQIESASPVCRTLADVRTAVARARRALLEEAAAQETYIGAGGTHPLADWHAQPATRSATYDVVMSDYQQLAREQLIFGCHVHVGVDDRELAVEVMNRAREWLAPLTALSANSPFWRGDDTGYASFRTILWSRWPLSGPPPLFESYSDYKTLIQRVIETGSIKDEGRVYWDVRLSEPHGTIEFRPMDVCLTVDETVMVAGLVRALVRTCYDQARRGEPFDGVRTEVLRSAQWRAARYGLRDQLFDVTTDELVPARTLIEKLLDFVREALESEGDWQQVTQQVEATLQHGNGAERQRAAYQRAGRWEDVLELIKKETASGLKAARVEDPG